MKTNRILILVLLIMAAGLTACSPSPDPMKVVNAWTDALNAGDIDQALSHLSKDVAVTILPPPPVGKGVYNGQEQLRDWYKELVAAHGITALSNCKVSGEKITCLNTYKDDGLKAMGVDFIEGEWVAILRDGKIQSYTATTSPESLAKFPPLPEAAEPEPPAATPSPALPDATPTTVVKFASKIEDIAGIWTSTLIGEPGYNHFKPDGTLNVAWNINDIKTNPGAIAKYWFEQEVFHIEDSCGHGTYNIEMENPGTPSAKLRFKKIEDPCDQRFKDWLVVMRWFEP